MRGMTSRLRKMEMLFVFRLFPEVVQGDTDGFDHEGGKGTVFPLNPVLHLVDHIVGEADAFACCRRDARYFEFLHVFQPLYFDITIVIQSERIYVQQLKFNCKSIIIVVLKEKE